MEQYRFQVNLGGMIELLSDHLYSNPKASNGFASLMALTL